MNLKKTAIFAITLAFCGCVQEAENQFQEGTNSFLAESSEVLDTKVTLDNDGTPLWQEGDMVSVWWDKGGVFENALYTADYAGDRTSLSPVVDGEIIVADEVYYAMSPYVEGASFADGMFTLELPAEQKVPATRLSLSPAVATTTGTAKTFGFRNACGLMSFSISQEGVSKAMIYSNGQEKIAGTLTIDCTDFENPVATLEGTSSVITLTPEEGETFATGVYYLALPPMTLEMGVSISLFKADGKLVSKHRSSAFEIKRSNLYESGNVDAAGFSNNYVIKTAQQLQGFLSIAGQLPEGTTASLANDIDLAGIDLDGASNWYGTFDGKGFSLKNWNCTKALFSNNYGTVKNLKIDASCSISLSGVNSVAFIATTNAKAGTISGCVNNASYEETLSDDKSKLFGFITVNNYGKLLSCVNNGNFTYTNNSTKGAIAFGMIAAQQRLADDGSGSPSMEECVNNGTVSYTTDVIKDIVNIGGVLGRTVMNTPGSATKQGKLQGCINNGPLTVAVTENNIKDYINIMNVGGVVGYFEGEILDCVNEETAPITVTTPQPESNYAVMRPSVGGVAGTISEGASGCKNKAALNVTLSFRNKSAATDAGAGATGATCVGGVFGVAGPKTASSALTLSECENSGDMTISTTVMNLADDETSNRALNYIGGVAGFTSVNLSKCVNSGDMNVSSTAYKSYVGGVAAINPFAFTSCDNSGDIQFDFVLNAENGIHCKGGLALGGVVGYSNPSETLGNAQYCDNTASQIKVVNGFAGMATSYIGGVLGEVTSTKSPVFNTVTNSADIICEVPSVVYVGGLLSDLTTAITKVTSTGDITLKNSAQASLAGGISGNMSVNKGISNSTVNCNIAVTDTQNDVYSGLLIGYHSGTSGIGTFTSNTYGGSVSNANAANAGWIYGKVNSRSSSKSFAPNGTVKADTTVNGEVVTDDNYKTLAVGTLGTNASVADATITFEE